MRVVCPPVGGGTVSHLLQITSNNCFTTHLAISSSTFCCIEAIMRDQFIGIIREVGEDIFLAIEVQPASKRNNIEGINMWRKRLQIAVKSLPQKGAANEEVCALISEKWGISFSLVSIERGHKSRQKTVRIKQISLDEITLHLEQLAGVN